jgi:hypothetical protein
MTNGVSEERRCSVVTIAKDEELLKVFAVGESPKTLHKGKDVKRRVYVGINGEYNGAFHTRGESVSKRTLGILM